MKEHPTIISMSARRFVRPKNRVLIHLNEESRFASMDCASFLRTHNLQQSRRRRGDCHDKDPRLLGMNAIR
jgi:putative transposase